MTLLRFFAHTRILNFVHEIGRLMCTKRARALERAGPYDITILDRVTARHPQFSAGDLRSAWIHAWKYMTRLGTDPPQTMAIGYDPKGRLVEMIAFDAGNGRMIMYHANNAQKKFLRELGLSERDIRRLIGRK